MSPLEAPRMCIYVCGTCGIVLPQLLWSGAHVVAGAICAHRDEKLLAVVRG